MMNITINNEKNGIELRFEVKPSAETIATMKEYGFRYSVRQKMWYAKNTAERLAMANSIADNQAITKPCKNEKSKKSYDVWELTRTESIKNHYAEEKIHDNKEIAFRIRKHLRERFPMCKWSVRCGGYNSIYVHIVSSPYEAKSDVLNAIVHYAYIYAESYNYDNSDHMSDYYDVNFYGVYEHSIVDYDYIQREATALEYEMEKDFNEKKVDFDAKEAEREEIEFQERMRQAEIERAECAKREECRKNICEEIEANVKIEDADYFILNCASTDSSKNNSVDEYLADGMSNHENCKVSRNVEMTSEIYDKFKNLLLSDFSFLEKMGGHSTDDVRIKAMIDYTKMSEDERNTVEWYNDDCVAIYCDYELKLIINPEGYSYARYVYFVDDKTVVNGEYKISQIMSEEEIERNNHLAETLIDWSADIIIENDMLNTWNSERLPEYKNLMKDLIYTNKFPLTASIVRAISEEYVSLKEAMYCILTETDSLREQFKKAHLVENQKITIVQISPFYGFEIKKGSFKSYEFGKYAQYNDAVKFYYRPEHKRDDYYVWLYNDLLIFNGWVDIPYELLRETFDGKIDGVTIRKTMFGTYDKKQYDVILEYFKNNGIKPIINTYKPQF